jgi:hypothetical protein
MPINPTAFESCALTEAIVSLRFTLRKNPIRMTSIATLPSILGLITGLTACSSSVVTTSAPPDASSTLAVPDGSIGAAVWSHPANSPKATRPSKSFSCSMLESNNCWKAQLMELQTQCDGGGIGTINPSNRLEIRYPNGRKALRKEVADTMPNLYYTPNYRYFNSDGTACGAIRTLVGAPATISIEVSGRVVFGTLYGSNLTELVCADGTTFAAPADYSADPECADYTARAYRGETPSVLGICGAETCSPSLGGATNGRLNFGEFTR